jgi:hypothetical protein
MQLFWLRRRSFVQQCVYVHVRYARPRRGCKIVMGKLKEMNSIFEK